MGVEVGVRNGWRDRGEHGYGRWLREGNCRELIERERGREMEEKEGKNEG
jgi:hypothetical protein